MHGKFEDIQSISIKAGKMRPSKDQPASEGRFELRDEIIDRIRMVAGKDSIKRVVPIQNQGDHKTQDIHFEMGDIEYLATIWYNNALTEGWVQDLKKFPKKC